MVEESVYTMMAKFNNTPLKFDNSLPKDLYLIVKNKWHYYLNIGERNKGIYLSSSNARSYKRSNHQG